MILDIELKKVNIIENIKIKGLFEQLLEINKTLWKIKDNIRILENQKRFDSEFIKMARSVYLNNDKRSTIKNDINKLTNSDIFEIKEYNHY